MLALGFDEVRFAATGRAGADLGAWLESGYQADMQWMGRTAAKRLDPELVLAGTQSVIVLGISYAGSDLAPAKQRPRWARFALHDDYHDSIKEGLVRAGKELESWGGIGPGDYRYYVDTGPVMERGWAARSGLGFRGKNGMLISRRHGNWLFLAAILTRARIAPDEPFRPQAIRVEGVEPVGLLCGKCTRCLDACPTAAFPQPGVVDSRRCISYHTIENRGIIPREFRRGIGDRVYGCDTCLDVCPWNRFAASARQVLLSVRADIAQLDLAELLELTPVRFASLFKGTAIKRLKLTGLLRNACVVAGNTGDATHVPALVHLATHESAVVRAHAVWAVRQLAGESAGALLAAARARETDPAVLAEYAG
ncbi:MAG TPA: tRNA epoxyqueuosine(34) reductase QueG [Lacunisphaera sp.]|nr:tRNA epoxyqueuosine(34) reductase QueG [Lacunisphaera sp.]